ncbi:22642_t:CDS:2, partial [Dentiscutata erythropus]
VIGNIVFVIILQNVIISFMSAAFEDADKDGKHTFLTFQSGLINDYVNLENSAFTSGKSNIDTALKDKLREYKKWESIPIYSNLEVQMPTEEDKSDENDESEFFIEKEDIKFIWTLAEE